MRISLHNSVLWVWIAVLSVTLIPYATAQTTAKRSDTRVLVYPALEAATLQPEAAFPVLDYRVRVPNNTIPILYIRSEATGKCIDLFQSLQNATRINGAGAPARTVVFRLQAEFPPNGLPPGRYRVSIACYSRKTLLPYGIAPNSGEYVMKRRSLPFIFWKDSISGLESDAVLWEVLAASPPLQPGPGENTPSHIDTKRLDTFSRLMRDMAWQPGSPRQIAGAIYKKVPSEMLPLSELDRYWLVCAWVSAHMEYRKTRLPKNEMIFNLNALLAKSNLEGFCEMFGDVSVALLKEFGVSARVIRSIPAQNHAWFGAKVDGRILQADLVCDNLRDRPEKWANPQGWRPTAVETRGTREEHEAFFRMQCHTPASGTDWIMASAPYVKRRKLGSPANLVKG